MATTLCLGFNPSFTWVEKAQNCHTVTPDTAPAEGVDNCTPCGGGASAVLEVKARVLSLPKVGFADPDTGVKLYKKVVSDLESHWTEKIASGAPVSAGGDVHSTFTQELDMLGNLSCSGSSTISGQNDTRDPGGPTYKLCATESFSGSWSVDTDACLTGSWTWTRAEVSHVAPCGVYYGTNATGTYANALGLGQYITLYNTEASDECCPAATLGTPTITGTQYKVLGVGAPTHGTASLTYTDDYSLESTDAELSSYVTTKLGTLPALSSIAWGVAETLYKGSLPKTTACGTAMSSNITTAGLADTVSAASTLVSTRSSELSAATADVAAATADLAAFESDFTATHTAWKAAMLAWCTSGGAEPDATTVLAYHATKRTWQAALAAAIHNELDATRRKAVADAIYAAAVAAQSAATAGNYKLLRLAYGADYEQEQTVVVASGTADLATVQFRYRIDIPYIAEEDETWTLAVAAAGVTQTVTVPAGQCYAYGTMFTTASGVDVHGATVVLTRA
jgi:hypothetical protein